MNKKTEYRMKMRTTTYLKTAATLLVCATASLFAENEGEDPHAHHMNHPAMESGEATELSLFNVSSLWQNEDNDTLPLNQIGGKVQAVAMVYTSCQYACPRIVAELKEIENALAAYPADRIGICLITIDPERDTVDSFREYAQKQSLDLKRWSFLRGKPGDILELANLLGVKYKKLPDGEFSHSNIITLLNEKGEVAYQLNGLGVDTAPLVAKAEAILDPQADSHAHHH